MSAPYLLDLANDPKIIEIVAGYLGCTPSLYSMNAWWSFGDNASAENVTQRYHRDTDDFRFCSLFIYLTDVEEDNGDHQYFQQTHRPELIEELLSKTNFPEVEVNSGLGSKTLQMDFDDIFNNFGYGRDDIYNALFEEQLCKVSGPAGSAFITDPFGLHRGSPSFKGRRLALVPKIL